MEAVWPSAWQRSQMPENIPARWATVGQCFLQSRQSAKLFLQSSELGLHQPLTRRRVCPPPPNLWYRGEGHTRWRERGWESPNSDGGTYTVVLGINKYFVVFSSLRFLILSNAAWKPCRSHAVEWTTLQINFDLCIPRKVMSRPQSQISHSFVCEQTLYSHDRSTYFPAAEKADLSWEYINRSQKHNVGMGTVAAQFLFWEYLFRFFGIVSLQQCTASYMR
jgi:hypothetical protein